MSGVFSRSWELTKLSFRVLMQDKEMLLFPFLGGLFSLLFSLALLYPTVISGLLERGSETQINVLGYVLTFVVYLGLAFIATFFNVCVVYTTKVRFEGGNATFMDSIKFAMTRLPRILAWSAVSATVGLLLHMLDQLANRLGGVGGMLFSFIQKMLGLAWSVVTVFVVPAMVYEDLGPFDAIKSSVEALKKTWGESLIRHYGLGLVKAIFLVVGVVVGIFLIIALSKLGGIGTVLGIVLLICYVMMVILVFSVLNGVFNTALFVYANEGQAASAFGEDVLSGAFRAK